MDAPRGRCRIAIERVHHRASRGTGPLRARLSGHPLTRLPESALPRVTLVVNGVAIPALLDTGGQDENTPI